MMTIYDALVDPTRRQILDLLRVQPRMVGELVELVGISQPGVSRRLRVRQDAQRRWYELAPEPLVEVYHWLEGYRSPGAKVRKQSGV